MVRADLQSAQDILFRCSCRQHDHRDAGGFSYSSADLKTGDIRQHEVQDDEIRPDGFGFPQGFFSIQQTCPTCHGSGKQITDPCNVCHGAGRVKSQKTLNVKIPAGVDDGDRIRLSGEGEPGTNGGPAGDLYVVTHIKPHAVFERDGMDLHCEMPISFATAALGGEIEIPTLDGAAKLRIPAETQSGQVFRLRGKGIKALRASQHGDLMCHVQVETPVKLTERQKELLREFDAISQGAPAKHNPKAQSFMDKLKDFFGG